MPICPNCGRESDGDFAFCPYCAAPLTAHQPSREQRKTVSVLFCDVTGSTALGESTDPEALRALLARYFERMKGIIESHGGTVEKFIGDAVMAVFGVPQVHEDDALRACRAAVEMRDALPELGLAARIGVNTGEVVTGTEERLATGDAVNVAARLEQAAQQPGEILIGEETLALVRHAVETEPVEALELKGKRKTVPAFRLVAVHEAPEGGHDMPFVGRSSELEHLQKAWQRALEERRCELATVVGEAGVGKSRLAAEFLASVEAPIVTGRCLPYGDGITYWPVVEVVKQLATLPSDPAAAASLRSLLGETEEGTSAEEIAWAFRKLLEECSPLVCVFDDIQWGEETFLDLVEHVPLLASDAPILLVCMSRPELLDRRPAWPVLVRLEPLGAAEVDELIPTRVGGQQRERITRAAGGNPLFVTEMVAMSEEADGDVAVPPTLQALLAARLDQLEPSERRVLECAAVEGEVFHRGAVRALAPEEERVTARLAGLVRRELIRPDRTQIRGDDGFRFRHLLIRDIAYDALPKANRAALHERFAIWLQEQATELADLDELIGFHLEQGVGYKAELGERDPALAAKAGDRLSTAGRQAALRGDNRAAVSLLGRALELTRPLRVDVVLELDLAQVAELTDPMEAAVIADAAAERAHAAGDQSGELLARTAAAFHRSWVVSDPDIEEMERLASSAMPLLEQTEDHAGLVHVWGALGYGVANFRARWDDWASAADQAQHHARLAGQPTREFGFDIAIALGSKPADEALRALDELVPARILGVPMTRALLLAMLGRFEDAWPTAKRERDRIWELSGGHWADWVIANIAALDGDHEAAVGYLAPFCEFLRERDERFQLSSVGSMLGRQLCALDRYDEAERWSQIARELRIRESVLGEATWRQVQALVHASRGEHERAGELASAAVALIDKSDGLSHQGDAFCDLADVLTAAGRVDQAAAALEQALERYERKKNLAMVAQVKPKLEALRARVS